MGVALPYKKGVIIFLRDLLTKEEYKIWEVVFFKDMSSNITFTTSALSGNLC